MLVPLVPVVKAMPSGFTTSPNFRVIAALVFGFGFVCDFFLGLNALSLGTGSTFSFYYLGTLALLPCTGAMFFSVLVSPPPVESSST